MEVRKLKTAYMVKGLIALILILLAIAFAVALYRSNNIGGAYSDLLRALPPFIVEMCAPQIRC